MEEIFEKWRQWVERHQGHKPGLTDAVTSTPRSKPLESMRRRGKNPYPKDQPGFSSPEAEDVPPPPLPPRLNRPVREREPQAVQGYMISDIRASNADTRQEYATDTVATRPEIIPSHAATRLEIIPSHAATRQDYMISDIRSSNADTRQEYATDTVATRPEIIPTHAATRPEIIPSHAATRPEIIPSHAATRQDYMISDIRASNADTRQEYATDTVATRPEIIPSHAATRQDYMISDIRSSNADTRQEYATDTVATRPEIIPSHAATRPEIIPSYAATRQEIIPSYAATRPEIIPSHAATRQDYMISDIRSSNADTRQEYATDTVATRPEIIPSHAATRPEIIPSYAATRQEIIPSYAATRQEIIPSYAATRPEMIPSHAATRQEYMISDIRLSNADTRQDYATDTVATRPEIIPSYAATRPEMISSHAATRPDYMISDMRLSNADTRQEYATDRVATRPSIIPSHVATRPRMHSTPADTRQSLNRAYPEGEFPMHSQSNELDFGCDYRDSRTRPRRSRSTPEHGQHQNPAVISDPSGDGYQISNKLERGHLPEGGTRSSRKERADPRPPGSSSEVAYEQASYMREVSHAEGSPERRFINIEPIRDQRRMMEPIIKMQAMREETKLLPSETSSRLTKRESLGASSGQQKESGRDNSPYYCYNDSSSLMDPPYHDYHHLSFTDPTSGATISSYPGSGMKRVHFSHSCSGSAPSSRSAGSMDAQYGSSSQFSEPEDSSSSEQMPQPRGDHGGRCDTVPVRPLGEAPLNPRRPSRRTRILYEERDPSPSSDLMFSGGESPFPRSHHTSMKRSPSSRRRISSPECNSDSPVDAKYRPDTRDPPQKMRYQHDGEDLPTGAAYVRPRRRGVSLQPATRAEHFPSSDHRPSGHNSVGMFSVKPRNHSTPRPRSHQSYSCYRTGHRSPSSSPSFSDSEDSVSQDSHLTYRKAKKSRKARDSRHSDPARWRDSDDNRSWPSTRRSKPTRKDPPRFKGGKSDVHDFLVQFDLVCEYNEWSYRDAGFELASSLEEGARSVINSLPADKRCDYDSLSLALRNRFQPPGRERKSAVGIWERTMQKGEDAFGYANALRQMEKEAYPGKPLGDVTMMALYINGLRDPEMKRYVRRCNPITFEEAVEIASRDEADAGPTLPERSRKPRPEMVASVGASTAPQKEETNSTSLTDDDKVQLKERLRRLELRMKHAGKKGPMLCYRCMEPGHLVRDCPYPQSYRPPQENATASPSVPLNGH